MIKNIILKLTLFSLIAGTTFMPQPMYGMDWKKWAIDGAAWTGLIYGGYKLYQWYNQTQEELNKQLLDAARSGDLKTVKNCLYYRADIEAQDRYGRTSLMWACDNNGNIETARFLIDNGANINAKNNDGLTSLMWACDNGYIETARFLIDNGANINAKDNYGWTSLIRACNEGNIEIIQLLIDYGADIEAKNNYGRTSLMWACNNGYIEIARLLIDNGANIATRNKGNKTAYDIASLIGYRTLAQYLLNVQNELATFKINPLQIITFAPKSAYLKMLYKNTIYYIDTTRYSDLCYVFSRFQETDHNEDLKTILNECTFLKCKEELEKFKKIGFPLSSQELTTQENFIKNTKESNFFDFKFFYNNN